MEYPFQSVKRIYKVKEDKFYLISHNNDTFILEIEHLSLNESIVNDEIILCIIRLINISMQKVKYKD